MARRKQAMRSRAWMLLVAVPLAVIAAFAVAALLLVRAGGAPAVAAADEHWDAAMTATDALRVCREQLESASATGAAPPPEGCIASLEEMGGVARAELDAAEEAAGRIADEMTRDAYLDAIAEARAALLEADRAVPLVREAGTLGEGAVAVRELAGEGWRTIPGGIGSGDYAQHAPLVDQARRSVAAFHEARDALDGMARIVGRRGDPDEVSDVEAAYALLDARRKVAEESLLGHQQALARRPDSQAASARRYEELRRSAAAIPSPRFFDDPGAFFRTAVERLKAAEKRLQSAREKHDAVVAEMD